MKQAAGVFLRNDSLAVSCGPFLESGEVCRDQNEKEEKDR